MRGLGGGLVLVAGENTHHAPHDLIMTSFQLRTQKYATDLQNSNGETSKP
jgi:hypothetical protein